MAKKNVHPLQKVYISGAVHDVRSPQNVGAVLGMLCARPIRQRISLAWLLLWGHKKMTKGAKA